MNAIKCAVCLESHVPRKMNVNVGCGHVSICNGCIENDETIQRHGRTDEQNVYQGWWHGNCPICRTPGNFINIYLETTDENDEYTFFTNNNIDFTSQNDPRVIKLNQIMAGNISPNYKIITEKEGGLILMNNIKSEDLVMAFYGTESDIYNNHNPRFIDVTNRIRLALNVGRNVFWVSDDKLLKFTPSFKECDWLLILVCH
tara:strand:+ start:146 stop:748 length:603 start_codon:yes stop_codon:yes gene_type:complete